MIHVVAADWEFWKTGEKAKWWDLLINPLIYQGTTVLHQKIAKLNIHICNKESLASYGMVIARDKCSKNEHHSLTRIFYLLSKIFTFSFSYTVLSNSVDWREWKAVELSGVLLRKGKYKRGEVVAATGTG